MQLGAHVLVEAVEAGWRPRPGRPLGDQLVGGGRRRSRRTARSTPPCGLRRQRQLRLVGQPAQQRTWPGDGTLSSSSRRVPAPHRLALLGLGVEEPDRDACRPRRPAPGSAFTAARRLARTAAGSVPMVHVRQARCRSRSPARRPASGLAQPSAPAAASAPPGPCPRRLCVALVDHPEGDPQVVGDLVELASPRAATGDAGQPQQLALQRGEQRLLPGRRPRPSDRAWRSRARARSCGGAAWAATGSAR